MKNEQQEIETFSALAENWWDTEGELKTLHDLNPVRMSFIQSQVNITNKTILDVGCGGGILSESLARAGALVTGIDGSAAAIMAAQEHSQKSELIIYYDAINIEEFAEKHTEQFDIVTCMELLEHVPDPAAIVKACAIALKPGGSVFFSTLNRTFKAYLFAILGAEYVLQLLPKQTHDYAKFITPAELAAWSRQAALEPTKIMGMDYQPFSRKANLTADVDINYLMQCIKSE